MTKNNSKFQKGSGVYTCMICEKQTRETGQGESQFCLCAPCMEISQTENGHSDGGHSGDVWDCEECVSSLSKPAKSHLGAYRKAQAGEV